MKGYKTVMQSAAEVTERRSLPPPSPLPPSPPPPPNHSLFRFLSGAAPIITNLPASVELQDDVKEETIVFNVTGYDADPGDIAIFVIPGDEDDLDALPFVVEAVSGQYLSLSVSLSVCLSVCLSLSLSVCVSLCLSVSVSLCLCLSACLSVCLSVCLRQSVCLSICLSLRLSVCRTPSVSVSVDLCLCLSL